MPLLNLHTGQTASAPHISADNPPLSVAKKTSIPALEELKRRAQWVLRDTNKVPYDAAWLLHGDEQRGASSTDERTWSTFEEAEAAYRQHRADYAGLGFMFKRGGGLAFVDYDHCLGEHGQLLEWARPYVEPLLQCGAYGEISPSGDGLHFFVHGAVPHPTGKGIAEPIYDATGHKIGKIEIYSQERYSTITGRRYHLAGEQLVNAQATITSLYEALQRLRAARGSSGSSIGSGDRTPAKIDAALLASIDPRVHIGQDGIPLGLSDQSQTRHILGDALARAAFKKADSSDEDWSVLRWIVTKGLHLVGYAPEDILALCRHYHEILNGTKRSGDFDTDILCCVQHWREAYPRASVHPAVVRRRNSETVPAAWPPANEPAPKSRATKRRPQKVAGAAGYLLWLHSRVDASATVMASQTDLAHELGISERTVSRYEKVLVEAGKVERTTHRYGRGDRSYSYLVLLSGDNIPPEAIKPDKPIVVTAEALERIATPQTDSADTQKEHASCVATYAPDTAPPAVDEPQASGQVATTERVPSSPAPDAPQAPRSRKQVLDSLVVEALELCAADERASADTGEIRAGRASWRFVLEYVNARERYLEAAIRGRYDYWQKRRRWLRQIAKLRRDVPLYRERKLYGLANWCARILSAGEEEPRYPVASQYYDVVEAELERRVALRAAVLAREPDKAERPRSKKGTVSAVPLEELPLFLTPVVEVLSA